MEEVEDKKSKKEKKEKKEKKRKLEEENAEVEVIAEVETHEDADGEGDAEKKARKKAKKEAKQLKRLEEAAAAEAEAATDEEEQRDEEESSKNKKGKSMKKDTSIREALPIILKGQRREQISFAVQAFDDVGFRTVGGLLEVHDNLDCQYLNRTYDIPIGIASSISEFLQMMNCGSGSNEGVVAVGISPGEDLWARKIEELSFTLGLLERKVKNLTRVETRTLTPSEGCKSSHEDEFLGLLKALRLEFTMRLRDLATAGVVAEDCSYLPWNQPTKLPESVSSYYIPLSEYIKQHTNRTKVHIVSDGHLIPTGNLFNVEVFTLRLPPRGSSVCVSNDGELRKVPMEDDRPRLNLNLTGRPDLVVVRESSTLKNVSRTEALYAIEVKTATATTTGMIEGNVHECLREAFLQLVGLNAYNPYSSPAVILTNLTSLHFVLYFNRTIRRSSRSGENRTTIEYPLIILEFTTFAHALFYVEKNLTSRYPITDSFPPPPFSPLWPSTESSDSDEDCCRFGNVQLRAL